MAGQFIWYELMTTNLEQSTSFLAGLLDCDVLRTEEDMPALFLAPKGTESALFGILPMKGGVGRRSHWIGYLMVDDLDKAVAYTQEQGGTLHVLSDDEEGHDPGAPRFALMTDAQGVVMNLHETVEGPPESDDLPELGRLAWVELLTTNVEAAAEFYRNLVGWEIGPAHPRGDEGMARALINNGRTFGLLRDLPAGSPVPPHFEFYLRVPDLDRAIAHARVLKGFAYEEPADVDGGRRALMLDPTGAPVALWAVR